MKHIHLTIFLVINISVNLSLGADQDSRLNDALRNSTQSRLSGQYNNNNNNEQQNGQNDNILKSEAQKMLKQCGVEKNDTSDNNDNKFGGNGFRNNDRNGYGGNNANYRNSYSDNNMGSNYNQFGQDQDNNGGSSGNSGNQEWNTYGSQNWNRNQNSDGDDYNSNSNKRQSDYNSQQSNYGQSNSDSNRFNYANSGNQNDFGNQNNHNGNNGNQNSRPTSGYGSNFNQNDQDSFNNNDQVYNSGGSDRGFQSSSTNVYGMRSPNTGFNRGNAQGDDCRNDDNRDFNSNAFGYNTGMTFGFDRQRHQKRSNYFNRGENQENDDNQLDDDRSPSETMLIKWLQEHVTGNDMDRIKALRDARRCFGRLTTNDIEDGCEFSKELANCLELELE